MAKYPRRRFSRRSNKKRLTKKSIYRNKSARSQAMQIAKLDTKLDRLTKDTIQRIYYKYSDFTDTPGRIYMNQWIHPSAWTKVFNSQASNEVQQSCYVRKVVGQTLVQVADQAHSSPFQCSFFVVTLKKKTAIQFLYETTNGANLVENEHFTYATLTDSNFQGNALVYMNKDIFNIHLCKRFQLGESPFYQSTYPTDSTYVTNIKDANKRFSWSIPYRKRLKTDNSGTSDIGWKTMTDASIPPTDRVFTYLFSNAPTATASEVSIGTNLMLEIETVK